MLVCERGMREGENRKSQRLRGTERKYVLNTNLNSSAIAGLFVTSTEASEQGLAHAITL